jgi:hypothetical protein
MDGLSAGILVSNLSIRPLSSAEYSSLTMGLRGSKRIALIIAEAAWPLKGRVKVQSS